MKYQVKQGQISYGEAIGILLIENYVPFIPGDVANASSYPFAVRFSRINGLSVERIMRHDQTILPELIRAAAELYDNGARAITGDCGFLLLYQQKLLKHFKRPAFLSSLLQLPFIFSIIPPRQSVIVVTANAAALSDDLLLLSGINEQQLSRVVKADLKCYPHFYESVFEEKGFLDSDIMAAEVSESVRKARQSCDTGAVLLECSLLPPYARRIQEETALPVFDFNTMINYVYQACVSRTFNGIM